MRAMLALLVEDVNRWGATFIEQEGPHVERLKELCGVDPFG